MFKYLSGHGLKVMLVSFCLICIGMPAVAQEIDGHEPDDDFSNAGAISTDGQMQSYSIYPAADIDWITFTLDSAAEAIIETSGVEGDTVISLFDSQNNELMSDDDGGSDSFSRIQTILPGGSYYVSIREFNVKAVIDEYFVSVSAVPFEIISVTPNICPQGWRTQITIKGFATTFFDESSTITGVWLSKGEDTIHAREFSGIDAATLQATFVIPDNAQPGKWDVHVTDNIDGEIAPFRNGYTIYVHPDLNGDGKVDAEDFAFFTRHWMEATVPEVNILTVSEAIASLEEASLTIGAVTHVFHPTVPLGAVISSEPSVGFKVPMGSSVNLSVSKGYETTVPDLTGLTETEAVDKIESEGMTVETVNYVFNPDILLGFVAGIEPETGTTVPVGTPVTLIISKGYETTVPDVTGLSQNDATAQIEAASLTVGTIISIFHETIPEGQTVATEPANGSIVTVGAVVNLVISKGYETTVPDVTGLTQSEAEALILEAALQIRTVSHEYHPTVPIGMVIRSVPPADTIVAVNSEVDLMISKGWETIVPDVIGMTIQDAFFTLEAAHLIVGTITNINSLEIPAGTVLSSNPVAESIVNLNSSVNLSIASSEPDGFVWINIEDPGVSGKSFIGEMSKFETTNSQYCQFLNAALVSGDIAIDGNDIKGANGSNSGEDFIDQSYYNLVGSGESYNGATSGGASRIKNSGGQFIVDSGFENHPVTYVSWYGAAAFASYYGWRLPTEWEWQAVADYDGNYVYGCGLTINNSLANYFDSVHPYGTTPVGAFGVYGYGVADMAGNVLEWTSMVSSDTCLVRGGCWFSKVSNCTVSNRGYNAPEFRHDAIGFRVCR